MELNDFFDLLYESRPEGSHLGIWLPGETGGKTFWTDSTEEAADYVVTKEGNIYFQVGLAAKKHKTNQRCHIDEAKGRPVVALPGLFADIDIRDPVHKKENLPGTIDQAKSIVFGHGFDPTLIVHSGHGLQVYWLFKEMWELDTPAERLKAQVMLRRIKAFVQNKASDKGWYADSVQDLVRVLRPPGSYNCKSDDHKLVEVIDSSMLLYNPEDLDEFLPEDPGERSALLDSNDIHKKANEIVLDPDATVDPDKMMMMTQAFGAKFQASWDHDRSDMEDQSPSGYDYSLALFAAQAGWTPQEIVNLMIAHRRKHNCELKLKNRQYYARTMLSAIEKATDEDINAIIVDEKVALSQKLNVEPDDDPMEKKRKKVSLKLGVEIIRIIKYDQEEPQYEVVTNKGSVMVGGITQLIQQGNLRNHIAKRFAQRIVTLKPRDWDSISQVLLELAEVNKKTASPDGTNRGETEIWIQEYLENKSDTISVQDGCEERAPFKIDGYWYIFKDRLYQWARQQRGAFDLTTKGLDTRLHQIQCKQKTIKVIIDDQETSRSLFRIPKGVA